MVRHRTTRWVLASLAAFAAACSDAPQPQLSPSTVSFEASKSGKTSGAVERDSPLATDIVRSFTVDRHGGKLEIPETGLKLVVPSNALPSGTDSLTITVTAFAGDQIAYDFEPSGTTFRQPLRFEQEIGKQKQRASEQEQPVVSYFKARQDIDSVTGAVVTFEDLLTNLDVSKGEVKADIWHFSGYIVAWGRKR